MCKVMAARRCAPPTGSHMTSVARSSGGSSSAPPWGFSTTVTQRGLRGSVAGLSWRQSISVCSVIQVPSPFTVLLHRKADRIPPTVQTWNLSIQRQLPGSFLDPPRIWETRLHTVGGRTHQSGCLFPRRSVNGVCTAQGYILRTTGTVLHDRKHQSAPEIDPGESGGGTVLRKPVYERRFGHAAISRHAAFDSAPRCQWSERRCELHLVPLHRHCSHRKRDRKRYAGYLDPNNRDFDRGNCQLSDRRHIFNLTAVASTPQFANPALRRLGSGWQLSGIYRMSTGSS